VWENFGTLSRTWEIMKVLQYARWCRSHRTLNILPLKTSVFASLCLRSRNILCMWKVTNVKVQHYFGTLFGNYHIEEVKQRRLDKNIFVNFINYIIYDSCTNFPETHQKVTWSKFHTENPKMLGITLQNLVARDLFTPDIYTYGTLNKTMQHKVF